jgi:hypothetical protein
MAPRDLPEGASPLNQDVDYQVGAVFTRAGLSPVYTYGSLFKEVNPHLGQSVGVGSLGAGVAWTTPNNITLDTPPTAATVSLSNFASSQYLYATAFDLNIPSTITPLGMSLEIDGTQTAFSPGDVLQISPINEYPGSPTFNIQLPATQGPVTVGGPTNPWGLPLSSDLLNDPGFGFKIFGLSVDACTFNVTGVRLKLWEAPPLSSNMNYIKTYEETDGDVSTLALDSSGILWEEDVTNNPGVLNSVNTFIEPNTFAQSVTASDREYIALSNLTTGTDMPRQLSNQGWVDRVSQVGPGAPPVVTTTSSGYPILAVNGIVQNAAINYTGLGYQYAVFLSASQASIPVSNTSPGNILTFQFRNSFILPAYITTGSNIVITNMPTIGGFNLNNGVGTNPAYYTIIGPVGTSPGPAGSLNYVAFSVIVPYTGYVADSLGPGTTIGGGLTLQSTEATVTTISQVPNLEVGNQFAIAGTSAAGYDQTWNVDATPNADQLNITQTQLTANLATYAYNIITGSAPIPGEFISVTGTLNGTGIFNVGSTIIQAVSIITPTTGTFTIALSSPTNVAPGTETGSGIIFGNVFTFDPLAILGTSNGGSLTAAGLIGAGIRQVVYSFKTRNGYVSKPSPIATADITQGASGITVAKILTGPPDTIGRIVSFTGAGGAYFFNIPEDVTVINNGVNTVETSTWINDNTSTSATFSFSDATLLAADSMDTQGNDWFNQKELGSSVGFISYASRIFAIGEQNKVTNFLNMSFDGGVETSATTPVQTYPAGWTIDDTYGAGGSVAPSPLFGNAYSIINNTGSTQAVYGMITQNAFEDEFNVPIILSATTYSVRVVASSPNLTSSGDLVIDLFQPSTSTVLGSYALGLSSLNSNMSINAGTLLTVPITPVAGVAPIVLPGPPFYAAGLIQHGTKTAQSYSASGTNYAAPPVVFTYPNPVTAGGTLILTFDAFNYQVPPVVTDTSGNTWKLAVHQNTPGQEQNSYCYYVSGAVGGITTVTITSPLTGFPTSSQRTGWNAFTTAVFAELSGLLTPISLDGVGYALSAGGSSGSVTTTNANDVIISGMANIASTPSGYALIDTVSTNAAGAIQSYSAAYKVVSSAGVNNPIWTGSPTGSGVTVAFRLAKQNAPTPPTIATVTPSDLMIRVYAANIPNGAQILIDRIEPFPTEEPTLSTQLTASYADNLEAFDEVSGVIDASIQNQQPIVSAFTIFDKLYILKSNSLFSTEDNGTTEPNDWGLKEDSNRIGCCGINAGDYGEEWYTWAHRTGLYVFYGGSPKKISQEIQPVWDLINWSAGNTIWVRNDIAQRRILIGVPLNTPNIWLPNAPVNVNPTTPNVILMMNYRELNSVEDLASESPIHITYANKVVSRDLARKWSIWNITSPYADFIDRQDGTTPLFLGNGVSNSKIYQLLDSPAHGGTQTSDDGQPINSIYTTFGWVKQDFAQGLPIGQHRKDFHGMSMVIDGAGTCGITCLPDQINSIYSDFIGDLPLNNPSTDNVEVWFNEVSTRLFIQFSTNAVGAWFSLQEMTMTISISPFSPVAGLDAWAIPSGTP